MATDTQYIDNIAQWVFEEHKIITYRWLSTTLSVPCNVAQQMLFHFAENKKGNLEILYYISGNDRTQHHKVSLVPQDKLEEVKAQLNPIVSLHIYSVQQIVPKDSAAIWTVDDTLLKETFKRVSLNDNPYASNRWGSIEDPSAKVKCPRPDISVNRVCATEPKQQEPRVHHNERRIKEMQEKAKERPTTQKPLDEELNISKIKISGKRKGIASFFNMRPEGQLKSEEKMQQGNKENAAGVENTNVLDVEAELHSDEEEIIIEQDSGEPVNEEMECSQKEQKEEEEIMIDEQEDDKINENDDIEHAKDDSNSDDLELDFDIPKSAKKKRSRLRRKGRGEELDKPRRRPKKADHIAEVQTVKGSPNSEDGDKHEVHAKTNKKKRAPKEAGEKSRKRKRKSPKASPVSSDNEDSNTKEKEQDTPSINTFFHKELIAPIQQSKRQIKKTETYINAQGYKVTRDIWVDDPNPPITESSDKTADSPPKKKQKIQHKGPANVTQQKDIMAFFGTKKKIIVYSVLVYVMFR